MDDGAANSGRIGTLSLPVFILGRVMEGKFKTALCLCAKVKGLRIIRDGEHEQFASPAWIVWR